MNTLDHASHQQLRRLVYCLLIVCSTGMMVGRIWSVESKDGQTAMLSANDRSRWANIRALVDHGTYQLDEVIFRPDGRRDPAWYTIDLVRHRGWDGHQHYYSSKPPLLSTLLAGEYWLIKQLTGATLSERPFYVARMMLVLSNVLPMVGYFLLLAWFAERLGGTDWARLFTMGAAAFGTFLTTFSVTLNNHLPAAVSVLVAVAAAARIVLDGRRGWWYFAAAGFFAAFAAANELPALSFFALLAAGLLWHAPRGTLLGFLPAALVVAAGFFGTNYVAHGSWRPPYAHRGTGALLAELPAPRGTGLAEGLLPDRLRERLEAEGVEVSGRSTLSPSAANQRWVLWDPESEKRYAVLPQPKQLEVRAWDDWYEYEGSYWNPAQRQGVDRGEPRKSIYAFHVLLGHRGIFSLTPFWLLSMVGIGIWLWRGEPSLRAFTLGVATLTLVCLVFYIFRPLVDRNYGGLATGFRWMFWFTPLWLLCLIPAADALCSRRSLRALAWVMLLISVVSVSYNNLSPWSHSWIYEYWTTLGWLE